MHEKPTALNIGEKGQIFIYDAVFALAIFLLLFISLLAVWQSSFDSINDSRKLEEMKTKAINASDLLVFTKGSPDNWHNISLNDVNSVGLVSSARVIDSNKLNAFQSSEYASLKNKMNLPEYDFHLSLEQDNAVVFEKGEQPGSEDFSVALLRIVDYKGKQAKLFLKIYE